VRKQLALRILCDFVSTTENPSMTPHRFLSLAPFALTVLLAPSAIAQITPGRLCVMRAGDGTAPLTNASTPAFLDEYDRTTPAQPLPIGTLALPIAPVGLNLPVTISGTATSEGFLKQSVDGQYLLAAGYGIAPGTASVGTSTSAAVNRVVARISLTGAIDSSTALNDAHSGGSIRSAVSVDGTSFWTSGAGSSSAGLNPGMAYAASLGATTSTRIPATLTNGRVAGIFNNQLYLTTAAASTFGIVTMGAGLPTTSGQVSTLLPGFSVATGIGTISQYDFWFADAATVYVADDRTMANGGGIQKWIDIAGTWTWQYTLSPGTGCRGLTGISDHRLPRRAVRAHAEQRVVRRRGLHDLCRHPDGRHDRRRARLRQRQLRPDLRQRAGGCTLHRHRRHQPGPVPWRAAGAALPAVRRALFGAGRAGERRGRRRRQWHHPAGADPAGHLVLGPALHGPERRLRPGLLSQLRSLLLVRLLGRHAGRSRQLT
jgi:hypothetical protein